MSKIRAKQFEAAATENLTAAIEAAKQEGYSKYAFKVGDTDYIAKTKKRATIETACVIGGTVLLAAAIPITGGICYSNGKKSGVDAD